MKEQSNIAMVLLWAAALIAVGLITSCNHTIEALTQEQLLENVTVDGVRAHLIAFQDIADKTMETASPVRPVIKPVLIMSLTHFARPGMNQCSMNFPSRPYPLARSSRPRLFKLNIEAGLLGARGRAQ